VVDAQHKLEAVRVLQTSLLPLVEQVTRMKHEIAAAEQRLDSTEFTEAAVIEQQKQYADLVSASKAAAAEVAERSRQIQALAEELSQCANVKDEMLAELDRVQGRQRDAVGQMQAAEDQLMRAENMFTQLEARRTLVVGGEKKLAAVESRLAEIKQMTCDLDMSISAIANREQLVNAVKAEVDSVHQISARSKADLAYVTEHRGEV